MDQSYIAYIEQVSKSRLAIHLKHHGCKKNGASSRCTRSRRCVEFKDLSMTMYLYQKQPIKLHELKLNHWSFMIIYFHVKLSMKKSMFLAGFFFDHGKISHETKPQTTKPSGEDRPPTLWTCWHGWGHSTGGFLRDLYDLESRWRNSHVLVYHGPLRIATFWEWLAIYFHYGVVCSKALED